MPEEPQRKEHQNDILIVANPDIGCEDIDSMEGWSHKDFFQSKWDKRPHRIVPGETKKMPRWLAMHFANDLADHLLMKEEEETGKIGLMRHPVRRPQVMATIILGVDEYFEEEQELTEGEKAQQMVETLNAPPVYDPLTAAIGGGKSMELPETDLGVIPPATVDVLKDFPKTEDIIKQTANPTDRLETSTVDPTKPKPTKAELIAEAGTLGIDVSPKDTVDTLISKIKRF